jgi:hypothetical protein
MKRATAQRGRSWKRPRRGVYSELDCRYSGYAVSRRQIVSQPFYNYGIAAKWQVGTVQFGRSHRDDESRAQAETLAD